MKKAPAEISQPVVAAGVMDGDLTRQEPALIAAAIGGGCRYAGFQARFPKASQFRDNLAMCLATHREAIMRHTTLVSTAIIAGMLTFPALLPSLAQGQLPRPGKDAPAPQGQKGLPPGPGAQKGAPPPQQAQQPAPVPPAPYTALAVAPPKPSTDASLAAFRKDLVAIAQKKDRAALAKLVLAKDFFWLKEEGNAAGKKTGIDALATALKLASKDGSGWEMLGELASDETASA